MSLLTATISGQFLRPDLGRAPLSATIEAVADGGRLTYAGQVIVGRFAVRIQSDGSASVTLPRIPQTGLLPSGARWRLTIAGGGTPAHSIEFTLTGDTTWDAIVDVSNVPLTSSLVAEADAARDAAVAAVASVAYSTWQTATAYTAGQTVQGPAGLLIRSRTSRTSGASFNATEAANWAPLTGAWIPEVFGGDPTGTTDSTAAIQAAHDALPSSGGGIHLPGAVYKASGLVFTKPVTLTGAGGRLIGDGGLTPIRAATTIVSTSTTATCISVQGIGSSARDLAIVNEAGTTPTAGDGIYLQHGSQASLQRVTVLGFWNNVHVEDGVYWNISDCHFYDPVNYGLFVRAVSTNYFDHADAGVFNTVISMMYRTYNATAGIRWSAGGGARIVGNKINGAAQPGNSAGTFATGIDFFADNAHQISDVIIQSNSIANFTSYGIRVTNTSGGGQVNWVQIKDNNINVGLGSSSWGIYCTADAFGSHARCKNIQIAGNLFIALQGGSIWLGYGEDIRVGVNTHSSVAGTIIQVSDGTATYHGEMYGYSIERQHVYDYSKTIIVDYRDVLSNRLADDGFTEHVYDMPFHTETGFLTHTTFTVTPTRNGAVEADIWLECYASATGQYTIHKKISILRSGTGNCTWASPTGWTDITRVNGTAAVGDITWNFDTATIAGALIIKVTAANAGAPAMDGHIRLEMRGQVNQVVKGADRGP